MSGLAAFVLIRVDIAYNFTNMYMKHVDKIFTLLGYDKKTLQIIYLRQLPIT